MPKQNFFTDPIVFRTLSDASSRLLEREDINARQLGGIFQFILGPNGATFDDFCQVNIKGIGNAFTAQVASLRPPLSSESVDLVGALLYRFLQEYNLSVGGELAMEIRHFMDSIEAREHSMHGPAQAQVAFAQRSMPISILKNLLNDTEIKNIRDSVAVSNQVNQRITAWENKLNSQQQDAKRLGELFEKHARDFNFSGLHSGFSDMATSIRKELTFAQCGIALFGLLLLGPVLFDLYIVFIAEPSFSSLPLNTQIAAGIGSLTLTLLLLYFFRIILRKADSCRAQLVQIRLRMSLCRFIQPYTDYSKEVREKNPDTFSKFEALIFSGIVGTSEQLPSTFDGFEQLTALAKALRGKD